MQHCRHAWRAPEREVGSNVSPGRQYLYVAKERETQDSTPVEVNGDKEEEGWQKGDRAVVMRDKGVIRKTKSGIKNQMDLLWTVFAF